MNSCTIDRYSKIHGYQNNSRSNQGKSVAALKHNKEYEDSMGMELTGLTNEQFNNLVLLLGKKISARVR